MGNGAKNVAFRSFFCTKAEFTQKMQGWWESCGFETKEQITGLKVCDSPPSETRRHSLMRQTNGGTAGTTNINGKFTTGIILKTNNMQINIIEQISNPMQLQPYGSAGILGF